VTIPSTYKVAKLSDYVYYQEGPGIRNYQNTTEGIKFLNIRCFVNGRLDTASMKKVAESEALGKYRHFLLDVGDYVVSSSGTLGRIAEVYPEDLPVMLNTSTIRFRPIDNLLLDRLYLRYFLESEVFQQQVKSLATGSVQLNYGPSHLAFVEMPLPPIEIQKAIGKVLDSITRKIELNSQASKTLEDIAQAVFKSWFIDFDPVKAKMASERPVGLDVATASLFPSSMEDSELGLIPKGWQVGSLFDFGLEIESGSRPKGGVKGISSGVPSIGAESINGLGVFDFSKTKFVPRDFYEKMNKGKPRDFDVLLYKDGGKPGEFKPRVGMYGLGFPFSEFAVNEHVFVLRAMELGNPYLYFWIRLERTLDILRSRGIKAAIPGINQQDVGTIPALKPPQEILKAFNELVFPSISKILTLATESLMLTTLRDTLMPRLISGELQIPEEMLAS
jgi:type I restriction enzyme S subunit